MSLDTFRVAANELMANESMASALKRDREKELEKNDNKRENFIDLSSLYKLYMKPDVLKKYEDQYRQLSHVDKSANKLRGYIYFANTAVGDKGDLVAFISVKLQSGKTWVDCIEVDPKYRGNKLSHQLLDVACKEFGATDVRVNKENEKAIRVFKNYGFKQYDSKDNYIYMTNEDTQTENPVLKKDDSVKESSYAERYVQAYLTQTADDLACESIFGKKSKEELISIAVAKAKKKCDTAEKKALFKTTLTNNERIYKQVLKSITKLDKQYEKGTISLKDYKKQRKTAMNLLRKTMIEFNVNINNFIDNKDNPTVEEINQFADIINKIKKTI